MSSKELLEHIKQVKKTTVSELAQPGIAGVKVALSIVKLAMQRRIKLGPGDKVTFLR